MVASLNQVVREILFGSNKSRIGKVTNILAGLGVQTADDFRLLDWKSLESAGGLTDMEVKKIMRYVKKNFLEEYKEHKKTKDEETRLRRETNLLQYKIECEEKLRREQEKSRNELEKRTTHNKSDARAPMPRVGDSPTIPPERPLPFLAATGYTSVWNVIGCISMGIVTCLFVLEWAVVFLVNFVLILVGIFPRRQVPASDPHH